jgi:membrane associated rhomboid family serine protease
MFVFVLQGLYPEVTDLGKSSSRGILQEGEWGRAFTAMFLHADTGHLMGNIVSGGIFSVLACRSIGWLAWPLILLSGFLGNLATAFAHQGEAFSSIGASSAVFAALGLLTGYGCYLAFRLPASTPWASVMIPVGGGIALLGIYGGGGIGVDVLAHLAGFCFGAPAGAIAGWFQVRKALSRRRS